LQEFKNIASSVHPPYNIKMKSMIFVVLILIILPACTVVSNQSPQVRPIASVNPSLQDNSTLLPSSTPQTSPTLSVSPIPQGVVIENCQPMAYTLPTLPAFIPGYAELDESIGLHVTGSYKVIDLGTYRLKVNGKVKKPLELTYDQILCLPKVTAKALLVCPGYFEDTASWTGVTLKSILDLAGVQAGVNDLVLVSADGYKVNIPLVEALEQESLLAYEVNGQTLPILHGFPLRMVFPGRSGDEWIKWLVEIQVK